jgi:hypothetical protein
MAAGSSVRGLSSVTTTTSASRRGDLAHDRPLARVAVAARPEHDEQPPAVSGRRLSSAARTASGLWA